MSIVPPLREGPSDPQGPPGLRRLDQFLPASIDGPAPRAQARALARLLAREGVASRLRRRPPPAADPSPAAEPPLIVHLGPEEAALELLLDQGVPVVPWFHATVGAAGARQLRGLAARAPLGLASCNEARRTMLDAGFGRVLVLPLLLERGFRPGRGGGGRDWLWIGAAEALDDLAQLFLAFAAHRRGRPSAARLRLLLQGSCRRLPELLATLIRDTGVGPWLRLGVDRGGGARRRAFGGAAVYVSPGADEGQQARWLEAMACGLPLVCAGAAGGDTLAGAALRPAADDPDGLAAAVEALVGDGELRRQQVKRGLDRWRRYRGLLDDGALVRPLIDSLRGAAPPPDLQIQGPFETSYSLATLNRELAFALARRSERRVSLYATEGPGDYEPAAAELDRHAGLRELWRAAGARPWPDVVIRQMYPPRVNDSPGGLTLQYFGWEESRLPPEIVADFNRHLDGIGAYSAYVAWLLRHSGVRVPIEVVGVGVDPPQPSAGARLAELEDLPQRRLLHISSAFPRKGVDVLLAAFFEEFSGADPVCLILKTFPNPHNTVAEQLERLRRDHPDPPDVRWIDRDLSAAEMGLLYELASGYVHPARGEGFGLPVAEAMLAGVPVIASGCTGLAEFVSDATAAVIPCRQAPAATHLSLPGSFWYEPDRQALRQRMRELIDGVEEERRHRRLTAARARIEADFGWDTVAERWSGFLEGLERRRRPCRLAMVTTWNCRCGIAEYSAGLIGALPRQVEVRVLADWIDAPLDPRREEGVQRAWERKLEAPVDLLLTRIERSGAELLHIQFNFAFFRMENLARLIRAQRGRRPVVVTLHRTQPPEPEGVFQSLERIVPALRQADALIVHQEHDVRRLAGWGVSDNVHRIPLGTPASAVPPLAPGPPGAGLRIGSFGFLLPHKGLDRLLEAVALLVGEGVDASLTALCALHDDPLSRSHRQHCEGLIARLGLADRVDLQTGFLATEEIHRRLSGMDLLVLPYLATAESASASLHTLLALEVPMLVSDLPIFEDGGDALVRVPAPPQPAELAAAIRRLAENRELRQVCRQRLAERAAASAWGAVAGRHVDLYQRLVAG